MNFRATTIASLFDLFKGRLFPRRAVPLLAAWVFASVGTVSAQEVLTFDTSSATATEDKLMTINQLGGAPTVLVNSSGFTSTPGKMGVDRATRRIYFCDQFTGGGGVFRVNSDGTSKTTIYANSVSGSQCLGVAVDSTHGILYIITSNATASEDKLIKCGLDGSNPTVLVSGSSFTSFPGACSVDEVNQKIYVSDILAGGGGVFRFDSDGSNKTTIYANSTSGSQTFGVAVDSSRGNVYFITSNASSAEDKLIKCGLSGSSPTILVSGASLTTFPNQVAVDISANRVYVTDSQTAGGGLFRFDSAGGSRTKVYTNSTSGTTVIGIAVNSAAASTISSLNRVDATPSSASTVRWQATFAHAVFNVTAANFSLSGTATSGASVGTPTTSNAGFIWTIPVTTGPDSGTLQLNLADSTSMSASISTTLPFSGQVYTMDRTAPSAPSFTSITTDTGSSVSDQITSDTTLLLGGTAEPDSTVTVTRIGTGLIGTATTSGGGSWSFDYSGTPLTAGAYSFTATATDAVGNVSSTSSAFAVTMDTAAPSAPSTPDLEAASDTGASSADNFTSSTTPTFTGTAEAGATVTLFDGATQVGSDAATGGNWSIVSNPLAAGVHGITSQATDPAGNVSVASPALSITIGADPNLAPSFTRGAGQIVQTNVGLQTITGWATAISAGNGETSQTVDFIVTNDNSELFATQPAISPTGVLTFASTLNASGKATVTVMIHDDGGTANEGTDTSIAQTFTIEVMVLPIRPGDVIVADQGPLAGAGGIVLARADGTEALISSDLKDPSGIAFDQNGNILVADFNTVDIFGTGGLYRFNRYTLARTTVSSGGLFVAPFAVTVEADGNILVADRDAFSEIGAVFRVDPNTGQQSTVATGGNFFRLGGITVNTNTGTIYVTDLVSPSPGNESVISIDPTTHIQTILSSGGNFSRLSGLDIEYATGDIIVTDAGSKMIIRVDQITGAQTVISADPQFIEPESVVVDPTTGDFYVTDGIVGAAVGESRLYRVDKNTGVATILSFPCYFDEPRGLVIVPSNVSPTPLLFAVCCVVPPPDGWYRAGMNLDFTTHFTQAANVDTTGGTPALSLKIGGQSRAAILISGSGTPALTFRYTVQNGDADSDAILLFSPLILNGATIRNTIGDDAVLAFTPPTRAVLVDTTPPAISIGAPSVTATSGGLVTYTVTYLDANFSSSTLAAGDITLNATGTATGSVGVSGFGTTRTVTISSIFGDGTLGISIAAGTATDAAGNIAPTAGPSAIFVVDQTNDAPTIANAVADQAVDDNSTVNPFGGVTIEDADQPPQTLSVTVNLDDAAKGVFTALNGFTDGGGGSYTFSGVASAATTAMRGLVFGPTDNRRLPGSAETTTFAIIVSDGAARPVTNSITTVMSTSINDNPVAGLDFLQRRPGSLVKVSIAQLLANDSDPESASLILSLPSGLSANDATITKEGLWVIYSAPTSDAADSFQYTLHDGSGGSDTGTVVVTVQTDETQSANILSVVLDGSDRVITFAGIAGFSYKIQYTDDLNSPIWSSLSTETVGANGKLIYRDVNPPPSTRFYRTKSTP